MSELHPIPRELPSSSFSAEVLAAVLADLRAHPETKVGGTLGVRLIDEAIDQARGSRRQPLRRARGTFPGELPAILVMVTTGDVVETTIAATNEHVVRLVVFVVVEDPPTVAEPNRIRASRAKAIAIRDRVGQMLMLRGGAARWLSSGAQMSTRFSATLGDPRIESGRGADFEVESESTFELGVHWTEVY